MASLPFAPFGAADMSSLQSGGSFFDRLAGNPALMAGLSGLSGQGWGAGTQLALASQQQRMQQAEFAQQQQQRQRMQEAWGQAFPGGQAAPDHPLTRGVPPELLSLAQMQGPEEGMRMLGNWQLGRVKPNVQEVNGRLVRVAPDGNSATEIYSAPATTSFNSAKDLANVEEGLRKEYATLAKPYFDTRDAFSRVQQASSNPSAAGDVSLIFAYMRMLDPASTVREGEFATAQQATGVPQQVVNLYNRLLSGERLAPEQRTDFLNQAQGLYGRAERQYQQIQNQYRGIAQRTGARPENTIVDFGLPPDAPQPRQAPDGNYYVPDPNRPGKFLRVDP